MSADRGGTEWYYKLACGHLRLIDNRTKPIQSKTEKYCVHCDVMSVVVSRSERW